MPEYKPPEFAVAKNRSGERGGDSGPPVILAVDRRDASQVAVREIGILARMGIEGRTQRKRGLLHIGDGPVEGTFVESTRLAGDVGLGKAHAEIRVG